MSGGMEPSYLLEVCQELHTSRFATVSGALGTVTSDGAPGFLSSDDASRTVSHQAPDHNQQDSLNLNLGKLC